MGSVLGHVPNFLLGIALNVQIHRVKSCIDLCMQVGDQFQKWHGFSVQIRIFHTILIKKLIWFFTPTPPHPIGGGILHVTSQYMGFVHT